MTLIELIRILCIRYVTFRLSLCVTIDINYHY